MWDIFISHAWEDKEDVARPLAEALQQAGLRVWYDEFSLTLGDSLRRSVDRGLKESRYGLVILSPDFFNKEWPQKELDGLASRERKSGKVILPVWHRVTYEDVEQFSEMLADKLAVSTERGLDVVVEQIFNIFRQDELTRERRQTEAERVTVVEEPQQEPVQPKPQRQPGATWEDPLTGIEFVWIPEGHFQMGQTEADKQMLIQEVGEEKSKEYYLGELPRHEVYLSEFWMGKYPVTQEKWQQMMGENPAYFNSKKVGKDSRNHPVENVSWYDVQEFLRKLNKQVSTTSKVASAWRREMDTISEVTPIFRLPSEAEWEYAARAGTTTIYYFGDDADILDEYVRYSTYPVRQFTPNAWGLYDMLGNVWEWCADPWHDNYDGAPSGGGVWESDGDVSRRVLRGGAWNSYRLNLRCASRTGDRQGLRDFDVGFRLVVVGGV